MGVTNYLDHTVSLTYGSRLYGTALSNSDTDLLTLFCESEADLFAGRSPQVSRNDPIEEVDEKFMRLGVFTHLLAKGDPHWSVIALQYPTLYHLTSLLVSTRTVERMISMSHAQARDAKNPKQRAHGFRTAIAAFDLFTTGDVRYPMTEADVEIYHAIRDESIQGLEQTLAVTEILREIVISPKLRSEPNEDLAAEGVMTIYQQVWSSRSD